MNTTELKLKAANEQFKSVGKDLLDLLRSQGVTDQLALTRDDSFSIFSALPTEAQKAALTRLEMMLEICKQTVARGDAISSPSALLETFFMNTGLSSIEGLFENVQEEDSIELWDTQHQLVFANLRVFQVTGFSLEELFCKPWTQLISREDSELDTKILNLGKEMVSGSRTKLISTAFIPDHIVKEVSSTKMYRFKIIPNFFAPVYHNGTIAGYLCSNHLEQVK